MIFKLTSLILRVTRTEILLQGAIRSRLVLSRDGSPSLGYRWGWECRVALQGQSQSHALCLSPWTKFTGESDSWSCQNLLWDRDGRHLPLLQFWPGRPPAPTKFGSPLHF